MRARSDAEYYSKICIVVEECDETEFWLEYLTRTGLFAQREIGEIILEVNQLVRLFNSIKTKMKARVEPKSSDSKSQI
jgi:four helix bundle protein